MKTDEKQAGRRFGDDAGHILVLAAAGMLCLLVMAAAAVDVGNWYNKSNKAQRAADAASMAAVAEYTRVESSTGSVTQARAAAQTTAVAIARQNGYDTANSRITVSTAFSTLGANDSVAVTIREQNVPLMFAGLFIRNVSITRDATALMGECQATCDGEIVVPPPLGTMIDVGTGGDGWQAVRAGNYLFNLFHHTANPQLQCTDLRTNAECTSPGVNYPVRPYPSMQTNYTPKLASYDERVYWVDQESVNTYLGCWDSRTHARCTGFSPSGLLLATYKKNGSNNAVTRIDGPELVGTKMYMYGDDNRMHCYDTVTQALCTGYPRNTGLYGVRDLELDRLADGPAGGYKVSGVQFDMLSHPTNGKIYTVIGPTAANQTWVGCWDTTTAAACSDFPTTGVMAGHMGRRILFFRYPTGTPTLNTPNGICVRGGKLGGDDGAGHNCWTFAGAAVTQTLPFTIDSGFGEQDATAPTTDGHLFTYFPDNGDDEAKCYDWTTGAACAIAASNWNGTADYAYWYDGGGCMIGLGHDGRVWSFKVDTGQLPCEGNSAGQGTLHACTCADGTTLVWTALTVTEDTDLSDFLVFEVTVRRPDGTIFAVLDFAGNPSPIIDLTPLNSEVPMPTYLNITAHAITVSGNGADAWFTTDGPAVTMLGGSRATLIE